MRAEHHNVINHTNTVQSASTGYLQPSGEGLQSPGKTKGLVLTELRYGRGRLGSDMSPHYASSDLYGGEI